MPRNMNPYVWISLFIAIVVVFAPLPSAAQSGFSPADNAVFKAYVLDAGKVTRFIAGLTALAMAKQMNDAIAEEYERMDTEDGTNLAQLRAKLTRHPRIFAFFQRQNLTPDDAIIIPLVVTFAGVAVAAPGQMGDTVSPAQLNFVRSNAALMQRFSTANEALENGTQ